MNQSDAALTRPELRAPRAAAIAGILLAALLFLSAAVTGGIIIAYRGLGG